MILIEEIEGITGERSDQGFRRIGNLVMSRKEKR